MRIEAWPVSLRRAGRRSSRGPLPRVVPARVLLDLVLESAELVSDQRVFYVREAFIEYKRTRIEQPASLGSSVEVVRFLQDRIGHRVVEHFVVLAMDHQLHVVAWTTVAIGGTMACAVEVADILRFPVLSGAPAFIIAHNHPSGMVGPSASDIELTKRVTEGAKLLGLRLLDHVIVTDTAHSSFRDRGLLK